MFLKNIEENKYIFSQMKTLRELYISLVKKYDVDTSNYYSFVYTLTNITKKDFSVNNVIEELIKIYTSINLKNNNVNSEVNFLIVSFVSDKEFMYEFINNEINEEFGKIEEMAFMSYLFRLRETSLLIEIGNKNYNKYLDLVSNYKGKNARKTLEMDYEDFSLEIKELFMRYANVDEEYSGEILCCLDFINREVLDNSYLAKVYSFVMFRFMTLKTKKIIDNNLNINLNTIFNEKKFTINYDNGKNFAKYEKDVNLFLDLINISTKYVEPMDVSLSVYCFENTSNLYQWYNLEIENIFEYGLQSIVENNVSFIFMEKSDFHKGDKSFQKIIKKLKERENEYFEYILDSFLTENPNFIESYLKCKNKDEANNLIMYIRNNLFKNVKGIKVSDFEEQVTYVDYFVKEYVDNKIKVNIKDMLCTY
ncbi:MAG: hypothetical protein R3Y64_06455 [Peptostreptococcaceae bacterium]